MNIGGLQKLTLIDYPGNVACVVFLVGCNFRCGYCHNPELVLLDKIKNQSFISELEFFNFLEKRKKLLTGVVISGGEPTIHKDLLDFIKKIKKLDYLIKLDTNGLNPKMLSNLIDNNLLDYIAMDIKAPMKVKNEKLKTKNSKLEFKNKYERVTGVKIDIENIKKSIELIKKSNIDYEFRTTIIPGIHNKEDIIQIAKEISPAKKYYIQNFRPGEITDKSLNKEMPYPNKYLIEIQKIIAQFFETCEVR